MLWCDDNRVKFSTKLIKVIQIEYNEMKIIYVPQFHAYGYLNCKTLLKSLISCNKTALKVSQTIHLNFSVPGYNRVK